MVSERNGEKVSLFKLFQPFFLFGLPWAVVWCEKVEKLRNEEDILKVWTKIHLTWLSQNIFSKIIMQSSLKQASVIDDKTLSSGNSKYTKW